MLFYISLLHLPKSLDYLDNFGYSSVLVRWPILVGPSSPIESSDYSDCTFEQCKDRGRLFVLFGTIQADLSTDS